MLLLKFLLPMYLARQCWPVERLRTVTDFGARLKAYINPKHADEPFGGLSQDACKIMFLHWAGRFCRKIEGESTPDQFKMMCPVLWCRVIFDDLAAILMHIPLCDGLEQAAYWCPDCSRPECFMSKASSETVGQKSTQQKEPKLKRAKAFFKQFGLESASAKRRAKSYANSVLMASGLALTLGIPFFLKARKRRHSEYGSSEGQEKGGSTSVVKVDMKGSAADRSIYELDQMEAQEIQQMLSDFEDGGFYR